MPLFTLPEILKQDVNVEYIAYPWLTLGGTMLIAAPNKSMKTFWGLNLATAIATGKPFAETPTMQRRTLYIDFEIGIGEAKKRLAPLERHYGSTTDFLIRTSDEIPIGLDAGTVGTSNLFDLLADVHPQVVVFDTLRMSHMGEENSNTDMAKVFTRLRDLKLKFNFTAVVIHHLGKEPSELQTAPRTSRGASVIEDFPDTVGYITKHVTGDDEAPKLSIRWKFRNHAEIPHSKFTFDPGSGLFVRTPVVHRERKAVKHESIEKVAESEGLNISNGLLSAVRG